jgi:hypothetical protein
MAALPELAVDSLQAPWQPRLELLSLRPASRPARPS